MKQWQKLIRINVSHLFHHVLIAKEKSMMSIDKEVIKSCLAVLNAEPDNTSFVLSKESDGLRDAKAL